MVGGFNTNVRYRGRIFHIQTEDSGEERPEVVTLLYEGGAILFSKKCGYEEEVGSEGMDAAVRELMESQHREMVRALKSGRLDRLVGVESDAPAAEVPRGEAPSPAEEFGQGFITDCTLDEVVLAHAGSR
jgi:hypothetical protein